MTAEAGPSARPRPKARRPKQKPVKKGLNPAKVKRLSEKQRIDALEKAATDYTAPDDLKIFSDLPISEYTKRGLKKAFFVDMTDIQKKSIHVSLKGKDVLGAARTGSGNFLP